MASSIETVALPSVPCSRFNMATAPGHPTSSLLDVRIVTTSLQFACIRLAIQIAANFGKQTYVSVRPFRHAAQAASELPIDSTAKFPHTRQR